MRRSLPMILIRVVVGVVFVTEGMLKFMRPSELGAGRFAAIGLPYAHVLAPVVGGVEIAGGLAIALGLFAGEAALALLVVMGTALVTTKIPILLGRPLGPYALMKLPRYGVLSFLHQARLDLCMIFALLAVAIDRGIRLGRRRQWYQSKGL
jgi:putative oxidoreductase